MTVFVTKRPVPDGKGWLPDLTPAQDYGPLEFIFEGHEKVFALPQPALHKARRVLLKKFKPEEDFLLHPNSTDQMVMVVCLAAIMDMRPEFIRVLYWDRTLQKDGSRDRRKGSYYPIKLELRKPEAMRTGT